MSGSYLCMPAWNYLQDLLLNKENNLQKNVHNTISSRTKVYLWICMHVYYTLFYTCLSLYNWYLHSWLLKVQSLLYTEIRKRMRVLINWELCVRHFSLLNDLMCHSKHTKDIFVMAVTTPVAAPLLLVQERKLRHRERALPKSSWEVSIQMRSRWESKAGRDQRWVYDTQLGRPCRKCTVKGEKGLGPASPNSESSVVFEKGEGRVLGPSIGHRSWVWRTWQRWPWCCLRKWCWGQS